jgi:hypothetical protein
MNKRASPSVEVAGRVDVLRLEKKLCAKNRLAVGNQRPARELPRSERSIVVEVYERVEQRALPCLVRAGDRDQAAIEADPRGRLEPFVAMQGDLASRAGTH